MTDQEYIRFLWDTGHFWNRQYPELLDIKEEDLSKLTVQDRIVQLATLSYQQSDANLIPLVAMFHNRLPIIDGLAGPATKSMSRLIRCPMPDFAPPAGVKVTYADPGLQKAVESMQLVGGAGSGSWPATGCDPEKKNIHSIRVRIDTSRCPAKILGYIDKALEAVVAAYAEIGLSVRYIKGTSGEAEIIKQFQSLLGSVIGWNEFPQPGTCNQDVEGRLDTGYAPDDYRLFANLECHETGHGVRLEHTRGGIMNPSILLIWPLTWRGSPSESTLKKYFGGEPITPLPIPPPPPPPPTQQKLTIKLEVESRGPGITPSVKVAEVGGGLDFFI